MIPLCVPGCESALTRKSARTHEQIIYSRGFGDLERLGGLPMVVRRLHTVQCIRLGNNPGACRCAVGLFPQNDHGSTSAEPHLRDRAGDTVKGLFATPGLVIRQLISSLAALRLWIDLHG
jgi:hypothetical protein